MACLGIVPEEQKTKQPRTKHAQCIAGKYHGLFFALCLFMLLIEPESGPAPAPPSHRVKFSAWQRMRYAKILPGRKRHPMSQPQLVRAGMFIGVVSTIPAVLLIILRIQPAIGAVLALIAGLAFTIGTAAELVRKMPQFQRSADPPWLTGIRFVFTLMGACVAPWLILAIITIVQRLLGERM